MLLVLSEEHKVHLGFLTQVDVEGELWNERSDSRSLSKSPRPQFVLYSSEGVLQDIARVYQERSQPKALPVRRT